MTGLDEFVEAIFSLFIVLLLGYVFYIVLSALSPLLAAVFILAIAIIVIGIILQILRRD